MQPYGALTLFFRWRKKSVQKKASGTATPEAARPASRRGLRPAVAPSGLSSSSVRFAHPPGKRLLMPILTAGLAMSRAAELARLRLQSCALGARLFPPSKWAGLFSLRCLSPLCSGAVGGGHASPLQVGKFQCGWGDFAARMNGLLFFSPQWTVGKRPLRGRMLRCGWSIFATQKASVKSKSRWPF